MRTEDSRVHAAGVLACDLPAFDKASSLLIRGTDRITLHEILFRISPPPFFVFYPIYPDMSREMLTADCADYADSGFSVFDSCNPCENRAIVNIKSQIVNG